MDQVSNYFFEHARRNKIEIKCIDFTDFFNNTKPVNATKKEELFTSMMQKVLDICSINQIKRLVIVDQDNFFRDNPILYILK